MEGAIVGVGIFTDDERDWREKGLFFCVYPQIV